MKNHIFHFHDAEKMGDIGVGSCDVGDVKHLVKVVLLPILEFLGCLTYFVLYRTRSIFHAAYRSKSIKSEQVEDSVQWDITLFIDKLAVTVFAPSAVHYFCRISRAGRRFGWPFQGPSQKSAAPVATRPI